MKNIHFIAVGGSAMHNLAIAMHLEGHTVTGSDDKIFDPSKSRLEQYKLMPIQIGWDPAKIHNKLDAVILGMHAKKDNPELKKAQELGLKIYSYPEYIYEATKNKTRVVIGGSHGKTTITAMILHVCKKLKFNVDYMVGAQLDGYDVMVHLSKDAKFVVLEGDEYLSSPIDPRPKFHLYKPHIALLSGIAWDHINVFPTFDSYLKQFEKFIKTIENKGHLIYFAGDCELLKLAKKHRYNNVNLHPYDIPSNQVIDGVTYITYKEKKYALKIFGKHNLQNLYGALKVCRQMGISSTKFIAAISSFTGASNRLELIKKNSTSVAYKDFAHSPSKLKATTRALKSQYPNRELVACIELHTFSSLNKTFLSQYKDTMLAADKAFVYFDPEAIKHKKLEDIDPLMVQESFGSNVKVFMNNQDLVNELKAISFEDKNLLMMSSGTFGGLDIEKLAGELVG